MEVLKIGRWISQQLGLNQVRSLIRTVIQNLDLKQATGIIELGYRINQSLDYIQFVVDRQLHRDLWPRIGNQMRNLLFPFSKLEEIYQQMPLRQAVQEYKTHPQKIEASTAIQEYHLGSQFDGIVAD